MSFAVIEFSIDGKIDIVPTKWIFEKNSLTKTYWPSLSKSKFTAAVNRASNPESKWDSFEVKAIHGYYDTVLAARGKLKRLENNTETSDGTGRRKRKPSSRYEDCTFLPQRKIRNTYASSTSSMSISETSSLNSAPRMHKSTNASPPAKIPCSEPFVTLNNSRSLSPKYNQVHGSSNQSTAVSKSTRLDENPPNQSDQLNAIAVNHSPSVSGASVRFTDRICSNSDQEFKSKVISSLSYLKMKVDQLSQSQEVIAEKLSQTPKIPANFRIALPVKTITEFEDLESRVANDPDFSAELASRLDWIGGKDIRDCTFKTMQKVISNEVAAGLNWAGHNKKLGFKHFELATIISSCVHGYFQKHGSMSEIEGAMKDWLKAAPTRVLNQTTKSRK